MIAPIKRRQRHTSKCLLPNNLCLFKLCKIQRFRLILRWDAGVKLRRIFGKISESNHTIHQFVMLARVVNSKIDICTCRFPKYKGIWKICLDLSTEGPQPPLNIGQISKKRFCNHRLLLAFRRWIVLRQINFGNMNKRVKPQPINSLV